MQAHPSLSIGLFGFGVVGEGLYKVLQQTPSLQAGIKKICIKNPHKKRNAPAALFTNDRDELLNDADINVIVEVINDADEAFYIVSSALKSGKHVVSASKKMIAEHLEELLHIQKEVEGSFLYESAACASIPVIRNLEEYYDNDLLHSIEAIVNGSTNYILTKIFEEGLDYKEALLQAQQLGFAETDPSLDVDGWDAVNKWTFLLTHAYGLVPKPTDILFSGIQHIHSFDALYARSNGLEIKLTAFAKKLKSGGICAFVLPQFVAKENPLAFVKNEYNGVVIESSFSDKQFFYGKGAGSSPTASALLSDIAALRYDYKYEYKKLYHHHPHTLNNSVYLNVFISFSKWSEVPKEKFEWIDEWHSTENRSYITGVIAMRELIEDDWWQQNGCSLILNPHPVIEDVEINKIKKKSLELAGIL